jgi:two-component system chemotaxis response regulator CheB
VIGLILSGLLSDGVVGLMAVKRCGGVAIVQDPANAMFPDLPKNALQAVEADYVLPISEMATVIKGMVAEPALEGVPVPNDILAEARFAERNPGPALGEPQVIGELTSLSCPLCNGPLQYLGHDNAPHYRCHTGHAFTPQSLESSQDEAVERALWSALRLMEERILMLTNMAEYELERGRPVAAERFQERSEEMKTHVRYLRDQIEKVIEVNL